MHLLFSVLPCNTAFQQSLSSKLKAMQAFSISGFSSRVLLFGRLEFSFPYSELVSGQKKISKTASLTFPPTSHLSTFFFAWVLLVAQGASTPK